MWDQPHSSSRPASAPAGPALGLPGVRLWGPSLSLLGAAASVTLRSGGSEASFEGHRAPLWDSAPPGTLSLRVKAGL